MDSPKFKFVIERYDIMKKVYYRNFLLECTVAYTAGLVITVDCKELRELCPSYIMYNRVYNYSAGTDQFQLQLIHWTSSKPGRG